MHQHPLARFQLRVVEQHVLDRCVGDSDAGRVVQRDPAGIFTASRAGWLVISCAKPSTWKPRTPATLAHRLSCPRAQNRQVPQVSAANGTTRSPGASVSTPSPTATTSHAASAPTVSGQLPLGERHAAKAPHVDVVQPDGAHTQSYLAQRPAGGGSSRSTHRDLAVGEQLQRAHHGGGLFSLWLTIMAGK